MNKKILVTLYEPFYSVFEKELSPLLINKGYEVIIKSNALMVDKDTIIKNIKDVDACLVCAEIVDKEVLKEANKLKIISKFGVGVDNIDISEAKKRNIAVANTPGANSTSVAELVIGMMISLSRDIIGCNKKMKIGEWGPYLGLEISNKTLGIIGLGNIGKEIIKKLNCFNMKFLAYDVVKDEDYAKEHNVNYVSIEELMSNSDFITLHVPLNKFTKNLIGKKELGLMRKNAFLINAARGGVVDEEALYEVLKEKKIGGAALDVFVGEPPKNMSLVRLENVITTPHIGGTTVDCVIREGKMAINNIINYLEGKGQIYLV